ncbi:MAG: Uma2 family endonuclease, partial [archaeon]|nr:Uma2 family endonuclease [archaeon]
ISSDTVVRPDILVTCENLDEKVIKTPEFIVEIVSTSSARRDEQQKFDLYQKEGVTYYILAYPGKQLAKIYRNESTEFRKTGDLSDKCIEFNFGECKFSVDFKKVWR